MLRRRGGGEYGLKQLEEHSREQRREGERNRKKEKKKKAKKPKNNKKKKRGARMKKKKKEKEIKMTARDREVLMILDKVGIARAGDIMILSGFGNIVSCRRRLSLLIKEGLIKSEKWDNSNCYMLTYAGLTEIERYNSKPIEWNQNSRHMMMITRVISYLVGVEGLKLDEIESDKELKARFFNVPTKPHLPDAVYGKTCFELELTLKDDKRLEKNILANSRNYERQIWIVPDTRPVLKRHILKIAQDNLIEDRIEIDSYDDLDRKIKELTEPKKKRKPETPEEAEPDDIGGLFESRDEDNEEYEQEEYVDELGSC